MRETEYRAWDSRNGEMKSVEDIHFKDGEVVFYKGKDDIGCDLIDWATIENTVLMQFIGATDSDKTKIFEGDILKPLCDTWLNQLYLVEKRGLAFCLVGLTPFIVEGVEQTVDTTTNDKDLHFNDLQIIGNKFENPELMPDAAVPSL
jgi:uncharacterized phage protein (TIGR01671 family)